MVKRLTTAIAGILAWCALLPGCGGDSGDEATGSTGGDPAVGGGPATNGGNSSTGTTGGSADTGGSAAGGSAAGGSPAGGMAGNTSSGGAPAGGASAGGTSQGGDTSTGGCTASCAAIDATDCGVDLNGCLMGCQSITVCPTELEDYTACTAEDGALSCVDGEVLAAGCDEPSQELDACLVCEPDATDGDCNLCIRDACCSEYQTYVRASDLGDFVDCADACDTDACFDDCAAQYPIAGAALDAAIACEDDKCLMDCTCGDEPEDDVCDTCVKGACCTQLGDYRAAGDLTDFVDCAGPCADQACVDDCIDQFPEAGAGYEGLVSCQDDSCDETCNCAPADGDDACTTCIKGSCCTEALAYGRASDVDDFETCAGDCTDQACVDDCATQYPVAGTAYDAAVTCQDTNCAAQCPL